MSVVTTTTCDRCNITLSEHFEHTCVEWLDGTREDWCSSCSTDIRGDLSGDRSTTKRVLELAKKVDELTVELQRARAEGPSGALKQEIETLKGTVQRKDAALAEAMRAIDLAHDDNNEARGTALYALAVDLYQFVGLKKRLKHGRDIEAALRDNGLDDAQVRAVLVSS